MRLQKGQVRRGGWKGPATVLCQERRGDGSQRGVAWIVHNSALLRVAVEHLRTASDAERYALHLRMENAGEDGTIPGFLRAAEQLDKKEFTDLVCQPGPTDGDYDDPLTMGDEDDITNAEGPTVEPVADDEELREAPPTPDQDPLSPGIAPETPGRDSLPAPEDAWLRDLPDVEHDDEISIAPSSPDDGETNRFRIYTPPPRPSVSSPEGTQQPGDFSPLEEPIEDLDTQLFTAVKQTQ